MRIIAFFILLSCLAPAAFPAARAAPAPATAGDNGPPAGQALALNGDRKENVRLLSQAIVAESRRTDVIESRVSRLEEQAEEQEASLGSSAWFAHLAVSILEKMLADAVGFAVFALVLTASLKHEFIKTVKDGMRSIGTVFADSFVSNVVPEIANFRRDAITVLQTRTFFYEQATDISAPAAIDAKLRRIDEQSASIGFAGVEEQLIKLSDKHPAEFKIVARLCQLYFSGQPQEGGNESSALTRKAIRFLTAREAAFSGLTDYYYFVAQAHCRLSDADPTGKHYRLALGAADKAMALEPRNPRWLSLRGLVHDTFGAPLDAIPDTEQALALALEQGDHANVARSRNNLAYYLAELRQTRRKGEAIEFARAACDYDRNNKLPDHISLDTLGYVLMRFAETRAELEEAVAALSQASRDAPHDGDIRHNLGEAKKLLEAVTAEDSLA